MISLILVFVFSFVLNSYNFPIISVASQSDLQAPWEGIKPATQGFYVGHQAIDISGGQFYILSVADGVVLDCGWNNNGYGNFIKIDHGGFYSFYAHLADGGTYVKKGCIVKQGQKIGLTGSTGRSTGNHLHFEIRNSSNKQVSIQNMILMRTTHEKDTDFKPYSGADFNHDVFAGSRYYASKNKMITGDCDETRKGDCDLPAPSNPSPDNGTEVHTGDHLRWSKVDKKDNNYTLVFFNNDHKPHGDRKLPQDEDFTLSSDQRFENNQKYFWRVAANCSGNIASKNFSEERWFIFKDKIPLPECKAPKLYYPGKDDIIYLPCIFSWEQIDKLKEVDSVKMYELIIYNEGGSEVQRYQTKETDGISVFKTVPFGALLSNNKYKWKVVSLCDNNISTESTLQSFSVIDYNNQQPVQPPIKAPELIYPKNNAIYELNISFYSALRGMSAKYPDGEDRSNISFRFELEIVEKNVKDSSGWLNEQLRSINRQEWKSPKAYDLWRQLFLDGQPGEKVDYTFKWRVIARNDVSNEEKASDYWIVTLVDGQPLPLAPEVFIPDDKSVFPLGPTLYSAIHLMEAKYPILDHKYLLFKFELEIVERKINDASEWQKSLNWMSQKAYDVWKELCIDGDHKNETINITFKWRVIARNVVTQKEQASEYWTFKLVNQPCDAPLLLEPSNGATVKLPFTFKWKSTSNGAEEYQIKVYNFKKDQVLYTFDTTDNAYEIKTMPANRYYYWTVTSKCAGQIEKVSGFFSFIIKEPCKKPTTGKPSGTISDPTPQFFWDEVSDIPKYILELDGKEFEINHQPPAALTKGALEPGPHTWRVKAICSGGQSEWSDMVSFTVTQQGCGVPRPLSPTGKITTSEPVFDWYMVGGASYYQIDLDGDVFTLKKPPARSTRIADGQHRWRIRAVCQNVVSSWSQYLYFTVDTGQGGGGNSYLEAGYDWQGKGVRSSAQKLLPTSIGDHGSVICTKDPAGEKNREAYPCLKHFFHRIVSRDSSRYGYTFNLVFCDHPLNHTKDLLKQDILVGGA